MQFLHVFHAVVKLCFKDVHENKVKLLNIRQCLNRYSATTTIHHTKFCNLKVPTYKQLYHRRKERIREDNIFCTPLELQRRLVGFDI